MLCAVSAYIREFAMDGFGTEENPEQALVILELESFCREFDFNWIIMLENSFDGLFAIP